MANSKNKPKGFNLAGNNKKYGFRTVPNDSIPWRLQSADGKYFGDISYDAYKAVEGGTLDSYKAKTEEEKNIITEYRKYPGIALKSQDGTEFGKISYDAYKAFTDNAIEGYTPHSDAENKAISDFKAYAESRAKEERINSNPTFARYNIDPADFDYDDLVKWASEHNHVARVDGSMRTYFTPKYKGGVLGIGGKKLSTAQEDADMEVLYQLANNNLRYDLAQTDMGALMSGIVGFADGLSFGGVSAMSDWNAERQYKKAGLDTDTLVKPSDMYAKTVDEHKIANISGDIAGSIAALGPLGKGVGAATKGVKWISKSPLWVQNAINSGITFAVAGGTETAFDGGDLKDVLVNTGTNFVGGALSSKVGSIGEKILFNKGLQHKIIPEMIRNGFSSAAFAGGKVASTYFLYPEEYRPTAEEMAKDIGVAFAFGAISSGINTVKTSAQNKKYLDDLYQKMASDYENMAKANISGKSDISGIRKFAKNVVGYSNAMEAYLTGKEFNATIDGNTYTVTPNKIRLVGQDRYVNSILTELQTIRNNANAVLSGVGTPEAGLTTTAPASSGATTPVVAPTLPGGSAPMRDTSTPVPPVVSAPVTSAPAADAQPATPVTPVVDTSSPVTPAPASGELGEIMGAGEITKFTPESANGEIKRLENILIAKGADDVSRQEIIGAALEIEKALAGSDKTIRSVFNNVSKITSGAVTEIKNKAGVSSAYWKLFGENFKAIPSGNVTDNVELITEYATAYTEALKNGNPEKYNTAVVSADGKDLSAELPQTVMQNVIPANVQNAGEYRLIATQIKNIVSDVDVQLASERTEIYGAESSTVESSVASASKVSATENKEETVKDAQRYNIIISNLKRKADELGILDTDYYTNLQNVNLYDLTSEDKKLISREFQRVFAGNTDPLIAEWLDAINADDQLVATAKPEKTGVNPENTPDSASVTDTNVATPQIDTDKVMSDTNGTLRVDESGVIRFNQREIDYTNNNLRNGSYKVIIGTRFDKTETKTGRIVGKYGVNKNKDGKHSVVLLSSGIATLSFDDKQEAEQFAVYVNENIPFNDVKYKTVNGSYYMNMTDEFRAYADNLKRIHNSKEYVKEIVPAEITDGKVPFTNKADCVDYLKSHVGKAVKVTFSNGMSEERTVESVSTKNLKTKKPDGSISTLELKGLSFKDTGFFADFGNGNTADYDFVNVTETPAVVTETPESVTKTPDSASKQADSVEKTPDAINDTPESEKAVTGPVLKLTDRCSIIKTKHTASGDDIWVVTLKDRISSDEYKELSGAVKKVGGYYSRFAKTPDGKAVPGFVFKSEPDKKAIGAFNDFFNGKSETTPAEVEPSETKAENISSEPSIEIKQDGAEEITEKENMLKNESDNAIIKSSGTKTIAKFVAARLAHGKKVSAAELTKVANVAFGGTMADNAYSIKDAYDAMELGVNQHILSMKDVSADKMLELLELLPTQTKRTEDMIKYQQFSTPPSIAYLANYAANVNVNDIMLEPSAGIGGIAVFAKKDGASVYVNELDERRLSILKNLPFDGFFNENAEQLDNILGGQIEPTVIVMNPPFSSSSERNIQNTKIGAKHIEQALKILAPNGRLVAIVGHGMGDGAPAFRDWWKNIKSQYNVRANIRINGKNYNKYGTNFDIQMLVIDKNGVTTHTETGFVDTLQELREKLGGIRDERPAVDYSANEQRTPATTRTTDVATGKTADVGNRTEPDAGSLANKRKSADNANLEKQPERKGIQSVDADGGKSAVNEAGSADVVADTNRGLGTGQQSRPVGNQNPVGVSDSGSGQSDIQTRRNEPRKRVKHKELTDSIFEHYQTQPLRLKNAQPHPAKVSESAAMSAIEPPVVTYKPNIPQDVVENGILSDVQLEAISYAGQSHSQTLPNGSTRGFFLGDGTGIGKGRTIAGMMLDNYNQGRKKSLWVTLNSSLVNDAKRDVKALFGDSDLVTQFVGGNKADSVLSTDEAIMVISYSALSKGFDNGDSNFEKIVKWLGKDFDGLIVFDEAHKMGNATATKGTRGVKKASQTGLAGIALQEALPKAKIVYSSATGATEVENLRYAERLGLWGDGTAFVTGDDFVSKIKAGGLAAMELIARDMKAMGVYLSRNISYEDVRYDKITHKLTGPQKKIYDELARSWQIVLNNINKALDTTNQSKDGTARGRALGAFWSSQQRFFNQILTSMQVPSVISDIEKQLADGKSCVIQLVSTNEAAQNEEFARLKAEDLELDEFDLTPKQMLMSYIENSFPVQQFEKYRDDEGNVRSKPVYDSKGNPVMNREAVKQREELLAKLGSIKVPSSPIDMIINHFGTDMVAENTGRARRVVQKDGKFIEEKIGSKKDADVDAFQNGNKRIIIFSKAGGTGKSYHADRAAKNQQQRVHYLLEAGWQADNAVQGFGRSHRSNQASAPIFKLVTTDLKGQMRFISTIAKRLDQLGAMTKGQRQAGGQGMFSASDNLENSFAADVLAVFYKDLAANRVDGIDDGLAVIEKLGLKEKIIDSYNRIIVTAPELREVNKFLNRILSLESSEQNTIFDGYSERLQDATEKAMLAGTLDKGLENYKADKITLNEVQDIKEDERSGAKTKYYNLTAEHKIKPIRFGDILTDSKSFVGFYQNKTTGVVRAVMQTSSTTDQYGNVTNNYKLVGQVKNDYIAQNRFYGNWTKIEPAEAEKLWNEELSKLPEFRKESLHLISGVVLPVWDKLPTENVRIYRVLTSDGEMLIGRVVSEDMIDETLRRLGSSRAKEKIATKDLVTGIKNGDTAHLENGWKIVQRKVSGENRIELVGPSYEHYDTLTQKGVFTERIQYSTRYFIPADTNTIKIIDGILKLSPVMRVENAKYSISESEDFAYEQTGNDLLPRSGKRGLDESAGKQIKGFFGSAESSKALSTEERNAYAAQLRKDGKVESKRIYTIEADFIKEDAYNDEMKEIIESNKKFGMKITGFFLDAGRLAFSPDKKVGGIIFNGDEIYICYNHPKTSPWAINRHELGHRFYKTAEMQKVKQHILSTIPEDVKNKIFSHPRYKQYAAFLKDDDKVIEEVVCDIMAGMSPYDFDYDYTDLVKAYWNKDTAFIDSYNAADYIKTTDAGTNDAFLSEVGFGNDELLLTSDSTPTAQYSMYDTDAEELTPERKKAIFEQFDKDRAGVDKPSQKQLWGERAAWVAHNMTRVFPNIPERGEKGTFFAEFRKSMIQWKNLPTTASFMVQDKLNKMTEGLTPKEFKTFSELVYFLDLQEEAQIQKERGYTEILLPNEITPSEVDAIVKVLNEEATENVRQALIKRQNIWESLKSQYIELNRYIGFDTDGKFKRKNYYHHQVIEFMNNGGNGTGSREIGIKAGRGWLKERQGSTKAINTDFLAVEYKAMLQMQYDVYIAETLGRIKQQYDIKPQLEKQAFQSNKNLINEIINKEASDDEGGIRLNSKGKPDSETYRQQQWYNSRIMFGFSGLFDLADRNELPTYDGEFTRVVEALKRHDLNVSGLYKYVGVVASTNLPDNATDAQEQAVLNARTVLKYTSQKREWIRDVLADNYQTWETLANSMGDTHTIHQPRRGNYFYTKTVIDEDAFNKAHNEMVLALTSGEVDLGNADLNKLFTQYADTVRLTGAAYEQWVLPNEIVTTMDEIANPKQATEGAKVARSIVSAWKGWATSINPLRTVKFGLRNLFGDLDAVIAGNPKVTMFSKKAVQDIYQAMRHKKYSPEYMGWIERGGYTSMIFANEMDSEMQDKLFSHLKDKQGVSIFKIPAKLFEKYYNGVENIHNFREAILRYSAYLYFKEAIKRNSGTVKDYVASNRYIVRGLNTAEDKAYQLSKDLLGAYDEVGKMGQTLRRYWIPFYSFTETNLKRYYRLFENIIASDDKIPKKAGKLLLKALMVNMLGLLMVTWNKLVMDEEDEKLPPSVRNIPHLTLGQIGNDVYAFRQLGSFSEMLEWFGLDDYKWSSEDLTAPLDKAWGMITPFLKMPVELVSGLNFYPSLTEPRAIRDKWQHFFNSLGVDDLYNIITGKPTKGVGEVLKGSVVYSYDYKESAYYEILDIKREYQGKTDNTIYGIDAKSNALYYMKTAVRYKDKDAALKYLDEYFANGGTVKGIRQSFSTLNPMHGFTSKDNVEKGKAFIASLTDEQKDKLKIAQEYYEKDLMLPENVLEKLGKKGIADEEAKNVLRGYIRAKCK